MSKDKAKIYLLELVIAVLLIICTLSGLIKSKIFVACLTLLLAVGLSFYLKREHILKVNKNNILVTMIIFGVLYLALFYTLGLYTGYYQQYNRFGIKTIIDYIIPVSIIIICTEQIRSKLLLDESLKSKILVVIICGILDSSIYLNVYGFKNLDSFLGLIGFAGICSIVNSILYTYMSPKYGKKPIIVYKLITTLYLYIIPITPNVYMYFRVFVRMLYPLLIYSYLERYMNMDKDTISRKARRTEAINYGVGITIILLFIALISCKFTYGVLVIGSKSMTGSIDKGDVIFYSGKEKTLQKGDVIVFQKDDLRIVHRIIDIKNINGEFRYYTKGDANVNPDELFVKDNMVIGKVLFRIRYLGKPTLWLRSFFDKEG